LELRVFADEDGRELFDLPDGPRPGPDVPAPARLAAEYDNLILSHDDRTRVMADGLAISLAAGRSAPRPPG
jgi:hypothetical protein